jgi:hypothetical protein
MINCKSCKDSYCFGFINCWKETQIDNDTIILPHIKGCNPKNVKYVSVITHQEYTFDQAQFKSKTFTNPENNDLEYNKELLNYFYNNNLSIHNEILKRINQQYQLIKNINTEYILFNFHKSRTNIWTSEVYKFNNDKILRNLQVRFQGYDNGNGESSFYAHLIIVRGNSRPIDLPVINNNGSLSFIKNQCIWFGTGTALCYKDHGITSCIISENIDCNILVKTGDTIFYQHSSKNIINGTGQFCINCAVKFDLQ